MSIVNKQFSTFLDKFTLNLDITETQYQFAVNSYSAVGKWLSDKNSKLNRYKIEILPQGSFLLGTMIKPVNNDDELDVDLVCRLEGKHPDWTQFNLKQMIGERLKENGTYKAMLGDEGRRCWTLIYSDSSKYHMDILPSIVAENYSIILEKAFSEFDLSDYDKTAIRITDKEEANYYSEKNLEHWQKSNPFGYAIWFQDRCRTELRKSLFLREAVNPLPVYQKNKLPLQRIIQILKRHRDIMFAGDDDKPISIIITTLAAYSYSKESDIITALSNVVNNMQNFIREKYDFEFGRNIKWIANPVNNEENFADKWPEDHEKEKNFYEWLRKLRSDFLTITKITDLKQLHKSLAPIFGENLVNESISNMEKDSIINSGTSFLSAEIGQGLKTELPKKVPNPKREGFQY